MDDLNLPWRVEYGWGDWGMPITHVIYDCNNNPVCKIYSEQPYCAGASKESVDKYKRDKERAAHIVKCVNNHDVLVEALEEILDWQTLAPQWVGDKAKVALAAARGEK